MANELSVGWSCCFSGTEGEFHPKSWRLGLYQQWFTSGDKQLEASVSPACFTACSHVQKISRLQGKSSQEANKTHSEPLAWSPRSTGLRDAQGSLLLSPWTRCSSQNCAHS